MNVKEIFVVFDPTRDEQPALGRSIIAAKVFGASIRVFACIYSEPTKKEGADDFIKRMVAEQKQRLEGFAEPIREQGIEVLTEVEWDKDWYKAVVRASIRASSDMVFKSTFKHSAGKRVLKRTSDWTLIRECLCPVLLIREGHELKTLRALAAIDINASKKTYDELNKNILAFSRGVLESSDSEVHYINAYKDSLSFPDRNAIAEMCGADSQRIHIKMGSPEEVIVERANALDASLVILGNSKRQGVSALIQGNTVEKVLDDVQCDVLSIP